MKGGSVVVTEPLPIDWRKDWEDSGICDNSSECHIMFGMFNRRHHCRLCGKSFCNNCMKDESGNVIKCQFNKPRNDQSFQLGGQQRICKFCNDKLSSGEEQVWSKIPRQRSLLAIHGEWETIMDIASEVTFDALPIKGSNMSHGYLFCVTCFKSVYDIWTPDSDAPLRYEDIPTENFDQLVYCSETCKKVHSEFHRSPSEIMEGHDISPGQCFDNQCCIIEETDVKFIETHGRSLEPHETFSRPTRTGENQRLILLGEEGRVLNSNILAMPLIQRLYEIKKTLFKNSDDPYYLTLQSGQNYPQLTEEAQELLAMMHGYKFSNTRNNRKRDGIQEIDAHGTIEDTEWEEEQRNQETATGSRLRISMAPPGTEYTDMGLYFHGEQGRNVNRGISCINSEGIMYQRYAKMGRTNLICKVTIDGLIDMENSNGAYCQILNPIKGQPPDWVSYTKDVADIFGLPTNEKFKTQEEIYRLSLEESSQADNRYIDSIKKNELLQSIRAWQDTLSQQPSTTTGKPFDRGYNCLSVNQVIRYDKVLISELLDANGPGVYIVSACRGVREGTLPVRTISSAHVHGAPAPELGKSIEAA